MVAQSMIGCPMVPTGYVTDAERNQTMTDNRSNEPTEEQIAAALDALSRFNEWTDNPRGAMRAALVAAQGAAPQAEQATYLNVAHSSVLAGSINARRAAREVSAMQLIDAIYDPDEDDANDSVRYGYVLEQFERLRVIYADLDDPDAGPAPLPSSGVDEDALAEVIEQARDRSRKGRDISKESLGQYIARIVNERRAEWLKEQWR